MLFHELYGKYYLTVAKILRHAAENNGISSGVLHSMVAENAFSESSLYIPDALRDQWFLLDKAGKPVLQNPPTMPLTMLEKRWMKAILTDPRVRLFAPPEQGLADVEPLFTPDLFVWFDRYTDGDPYDDPEYVQVFRLLMQAATETRRVRLRYHGAKQEQTRLCVPCRLEYSEKDDKFRLLALEEEEAIILNVSRIRSCELLEPASLPEDLPIPKKSKLVMELSSQRNTLERAMLHFSHLEKETVQLDDKTYRLTLWYDARDEQELLIRVLSFGPTAKVLEPASLVAQLRYRIRKQQKQLQK